jgi:hypothetical protein
MGGVSERWPVKIGDRRFVIDLGKLDRTRIGTAAQAQDIGAEASDRSISNDGIWKRTRSDFVEGAGQEWPDLSADESIDSNPLRFWWSRGLDVLTDPGKATALPGTTVQTTVGDGSTARAVTVGAYTYVASGVAVERSDASDLETWTACTGEPGAAITDMVSMGAQMYLCDGAGVSELTIGGTAWSSFSSEDTDYLVAGSGRLIGMHDNDIWEFTNAGAKLGAANIHSHFDTGFKWKGGVAAPNGVYVFGDGGGHSEIYLLVPVDATGTFAPPYPVGDLEGEIIRRVKFYAGVLIIATDKGIHLAQIGGSGFLVTGPLMEFGDVLDLHKAPSGQVYFAWSVFNDVDGAQLDSGVGRLSIDRFTSPLVPAYQSDIMAGTNGVVRCVGGQGSRILFGIDSAALDVYVADATGTVTWYLRPGRVTFASAERKAFTSYEIKTGDTAGTVTCVVTADGVDYTIPLDKTLQRIRRFVTTDEILAEEFDVLLTGTSFTGSFDRWTLRSLPVIRRTSAITLPVMLGSSVSDRGVVKDRRDPFDDWLYLDGLAESGELVPCELGAEKFVARVDDVALAQNASTQLVVDWTSKPNLDQWMDSTWLVRVLPNVDA